MKLLMKIYVVGLFCLLAACGDTDAPAETNTADAAKPSSNQAASPHTIQGMKNTMDDARGVEDLLQKSADQQRREIDNIR